MIWKTRIGDELYVFFNGRLFYKRWISRDVSLIFEEYGHPWR